METSKRKHAEELYHQAKKLRIANHDAGFLITEGWSSVEASEDNTVLFSSAKIETPEESPSTCSTNERAIVLYKPTIPELFLSKPIPRVPTIQLDMRLLTSEMLGPESLSASDTLQQLGVIRSASAGLGLRTVGLVPDNRFAVIPWVASPSNMAATGGKCAFTGEMTTTQIQSEAIKGDEAMGEDAVECDAMDEDDGVYGIQSAQPSSSTNNFSSIEPWQHFGVPQPQFGSVTWSH